MMASVLPPPFPPTLAPRLPSRSNLELVKVDWLDNGYVVGGQAGLRNLVLEEAQLSCHLVTTLNLKIKKVII